MLVRVLPRERVLVGSEAGSVVWAPDLKSGDPELKSCSDQHPSLLQVVPDSSSRSR